jgi:hypothetical protein
VHLSSIITEGQMRRFGLLIIAAIPLFTTQGHANCVGFRHVALQLSMCCGVEISKPVCKAPNGGGCDSVGATRDLCGCGPTFVATSCHPSLAKATPAINFLTKDEQSLSLDLFTKDQSLYATKQGCAVDYGQLDEWLKAHPFNGKALNRKTILAGL